jgi:D-alanyl-D-alanine carboxypeptidase/D-alanyl-D-alanine-endopeptidase (penicillin-binding protein 4)
MKKFFLVAGSSGKALAMVGCWLLVTGSFAQTASQKLQKAFQQFESDAQLKHAISSLYVIDAKSGKVVFDKNSQIGLAPASTQKIITSVTAFELLGKDYRYKTEFGICNDHEKEINFWINPSGDPTFGSWRWELTKEQDLLSTIINEIKAIDLESCKGIVINAMGWDTEQIPDGWIWQDIGNYYGAGAGVLNWRENQFDLFLKSGSKIDDVVTIAETDPVLYSYNILSKAISAAKGSGDNSYIYLPGHGANAIVRGTIPINENRFQISGSMMNPANHFISTLRDSLKIRFKWTVNKSFYLYGHLPRPPRVFYTHYSPPLDSIIYWFLKKSINLYGEALIKTIAYEKRGIGSTDSGVAIVKDFWKQKGIDEDELNISDGSGLSPQNRVTTHAQVEILKYAKGKDWFPSFYNSLPEYNGMKIKSGTIKDVKGFCGYHKAKDGKEYIFSFLVNNYNGSASGLVNKMYKVLDSLK